MRYKFRCGRGDLQYVWLSGNWKGKNKSTAPTGFWATCYARERERVSGNRRPPPLHGFRQLLSVLDWAHRQGRPWVSIRGLCRQLQKPSSYTSEYTDFSDIYQLRHLTPKTLRYWLAQGESIGLISIRRRRGRKGSEVALAKPDRKLTEQTSLEILTPVTKIEGPRDFQSAEDVEKVLRDIVPGDRLKFLQLLDKTWQLTGRVTLVGRDELRRISNRGEKARSRAKCQQGEESICPQGEESISGSCQQGEESTSSIRISSHGGDESAGATPAAAGGRDADVPTPDSDSQPSYPNTRVLEILTDRSIEWEDYDPHPDDECGLVFSSHGFLIDLDKESDHE